MKKILFCLFSIFCLISLVGCGDKGNEIDPVEPEPINHEELLKNHLDELIFDELSLGIKLPDLYTFDDDVFAELEWTSSKPEVINEKGVLRQIIFDEEVELSAKITLDNGDPEFTYAKKVIAKGKTTVEEYKKIVESYIPDLVYRDVEIETRDKTFGRFNLFGDITYTFDTDDALKLEEVTKIVNGYEVKRTVCKYINFNKDDQRVTCNYVAKIGGKEVTGSKVVVVEGRNSEKYLGLAKDYLAELYKDNLIYNAIELPNIDENERVTIEWSSNNNKVIDSEGVLRVFKPNLKVKLTAKLNYNGTIETWEREFRTYNDDEFLDFVVNRLHRKEIQQYIMHVYTYDADNYGFLPFYYQDIDMSKVVTETTANNKDLFYVKNMTKNTNVNELKIETGLVPWNAAGRTKTIKTSTNTIVVHDTGSPDTSAKQWNDYVSSGKDPRDTSWNFTVGEDVIYQQIPIHEIAWHAGCGGSTKFVLNDTGVKFSGYDPEITIGDDYLYINGQKSKIATPYNGGRKPDFISGSGLYTCIGENGNYYMADVWCNKWEANYYVCTFGGNANGVGIETDIVKGVDYNKVMRNCANLVGNLLVYFNLQPDVILQHRHFSSKLCPQLMIRNGLWPNFKRMAETEYLIKKYLPDLKLEYEVSDKTLIDKTGKILREVKEDTGFTYTVKATANGETKTYTFKTIVKPIPEHVNK